MKILLSSLLLSVSTIVASAGDLTKVLLSAEELPDGIRLMEPTARMPQFCNGKNPAVTTSDAGIKEFCRVFLRDEALASHLTAVSFTALKLVNEMGIFGHQLKDPAKASEIKKAYEFLTTKMNGRRFIEDGDLLILVWAKDTADVTTEPMESIESLLRTKLKAAK
jgi:hypothetical protein